MKSKRPPTVSETSALIIKHLYEHRCLCIDQLYQLLEGIDMIEDITLEKIESELQQLSNADIVTSVELKAPYPMQYIPTKRGVSVLRKVLHTSAKKARSQIPPQYGIRRSDRPPLNDPLRYFKEKPFGEKYFKLEISYLNCKISPALMPHQFHLNCQAIELMLILKNIPGTTYVDGKHVVFNDSVRPDGMILIPEYTVIVNNKPKTIPEKWLFLETDMGNENMDQLKEKFEGYCLFLRHSPSLFEVQFLIFFMCRNSKLSPKDCCCAGQIKASNYKETQKLRKRIDRIKETVFAPCFCMIMYYGVDVLISPLPRLLAWSRKKILPLYNPEHIVPPTLFGNNADDWQFQKGDRYVQDMNKLKYDLLGYNTRHDAYFFFLYCDHSSLAQIAKIEFFNQSMFAFQEKYNKRPRLIVVAGQTELINNTIKKCTESYLKSVCFTTYERLETKPFHEAIVNVSSKRNAILSEDLSHLIPLESPIFELAPKDDFWDGIGHYD